MRETSRGTLTLKSGDPRDHPLLDPNYLDTPDDMKDLRNAVKLSREIMAQKAFDPFRGDELLPGMYRAIFLTCVTLVTNRTFSIFGKLDLYFFCVIE